MVGIDVEMRNYNRWYERGCPVRDIGGGDFVPDMAPVPAPPAAEKEEE